MDVRRGFCFLRRPAGEEKETMQPDARQRREVLSPDQLAEYVGCGRTTVYELLRERRIPRFTVGRLRRIRRDVERYVSDLLADDLANAR